MVSWDEQVKRKVIDHLYWDERVDAAVVKVEVANGRVTLSGAVPNDMARRAAVNDARAVPGVIGVRNRLTVRPEGRSGVADDELRFRLEHILRWNAFIAADAIQISVDGGIVKLQGTTDSFWKKERIQDLIYDLQGVVDVRNELAVVPTDEVGDQVIGDAIVEALDRSAFVNAAAVDVQVRDGEVTLDGRVKGWEAYRSAFEVALHTPGVKHVVNNLVVE